MSEYIRILYIDDETDLLALGKLFLERQGDFSVTTVPESLEALDLLKSRSFDVILADYLMPQMDGIEFLKAVRRDGNTIPFILFTGKGSEEVVIQALNEGADFYLQKGGDPPSRFAELAHHIRQAVHNRRLEREVRDQQQREANLINFLPDPTFAINTDGKIIAWNRAMEQMTNTPAGEMYGKGDYEYTLPFYHERRPILIDLVLNRDPDTAAHYPSLQMDGELLSAEVTLKDFQEQGEHSFWFTAAPFYDNQGTVIGAIESIRDITGIKRTEKKYQLDEARLEALLQLNLMIGESKHAITLFAMEQAVRLTGSSLGYIAFVNEEESVLTMYAWSKEAMHTCQIADKPIEYPVEDTGLWGEAIRQRRPIITNDYAADNPLKRGVPKGHVHLVRHMNVPIFDGTRIVIVAGVANKTGLYGQSDIRQVELLMGGMWTIIKRKEAEEALIRKHEELRVAYKHISETEEELRENLGEITRQGEELLRSEHQLHTMADNIPGVIFRFFVNADGTEGFDYVSDRCREILGIDNSPDSFFDNFVAGVVPEDRERLIHSIRNAISMKRPWEFEGSFIRPSGEEIWLKAISSPSVEHDTLFFDGGIFDETDRKRMGEFNRLLAKISDEAPVCFMVHDFDGTMLYANNHTFRLHGYTREEFLTKNLSEIVVPVHGDGLNNPDSPGKRQREEEFEDEHFRKDGTRIPLHINTKIVEWGGRDVLLRIATDLSELKRSEETLHEAHQKLRLLTRLTRHDIMNQLVALEGYHTLAIEDQDPGMMTSLIARADRVREKMHQIIEFTKEYEGFGISSGGWQPVHRLITAARGQVALDGIVIMNHIPEHLEIYADPIIQKVFVTFFDNAIRHGGNITEIRFKCHTVGNDLIITCEDDGVGIHPDEKELIFTSGYGANTGIGLFIAREILSITGLSIRECGEPGKGARFEISVPAERFR